MRLKWLDRHEYLVSHDYMSSLFVILKSFWMEFSEQKTELVCFLSLTEGTEVVVNSIAEDVCGSEDELTGALSDKVESWD